MSDLERSKRTAGAADTLRWRSRSFCWLKAPKARYGAGGGARAFGAARAHVTCALALARCEALADLVRAEGFETSEGFVDVDGRLTRLDSALPALAQQASSACETFAAASSGDFSGVFPFPWRETLVECSAFGSALQSPPTLAALAATAHVDVCVLGCFRETSQRRDGSDVSSPDATSKQNLFDARLEEIRAWRRAALATATPRVSRALTTVLDRTFRRLFLAKHAVSELRRGFVVRGVRRRESTAGFRDERSQCSTPSPRYSASWRSAPPTRAFDPRAPEDARDASDALVAVLSALLGEDHPETGAAKTIAAEAAARAAVDGGFHGFHSSESFPLRGEEPLLSSTPTDQYSSQIATIVAWSRPAYAFAERFYGARSLPAARAAWCVAEGARRGSASDASRGGGASVKSSAPRPSAQSGRSAGGAARAPRGPCTRRRSVRPWPRSAARTAARARRFVAAGALRAERRAEEARALVEEGARRAKTPPPLRRSATRSSPPGSARWKRRVVSATRVRPKQQTDLASQRITTLTTSSSTFVREASKRPSPPPRRACAAEPRRTEFRDAALLARDDADTGDARSLTEAEAQLRHALACHERADGPGCAASAPTLAALGRCATDRRRAEEAEACSRHGRAADGAAARETLRLCNAARNNPPVRTSARGLSAPAFGVSPRGHRRVAPARERAHAGGGALHAALTRRRRRRRFRSRRASVGTDDPDDERQPPRVTTPTQARS